MYHELCQETKDWSASVQERSMWKQAQISGISWETITVRQMTLFVANKVSCLTSEFVLFTLADTFQILEGSNIRQ